jgi:hypothetical protein
MKAKVKINSIILLNLLMMSYASAQGGWIGNTPIEIINEVDFLGDVIDAYSDYRYPEFRFIIQNGTG